jgi:hypothetical protein
VAGGWRKLHKEMLHNFFISPNIFGAIKTRMVMWAEHAECMCEMRNENKILVGIPEVKRPLVGPRRRRQDITIDLREKGQEGVGRIHLAQDRTRSGPSSTR